MLATVFGIALAKTKLLNNYLFKDIHISNLYLYLYFSGRPVLSDNGLKQDGSRETSRISSQSKLDT